MKFKEFLQKLIEVDIRIIRNIRQWIFLKLKIIKHDPLQEMIKEVIKDKSVINFDDWCADLERRRENCEH